MSLVADYGSDSEDDSSLLHSSNSPAPAPAPASTPAALKPRAAVPEPREGKSLFNPKAFSAISTGKSSVKKFVVDLKFGDDGGEDDEEEKREQERKKRRLLESRAKSEATGLTSLLPPPKNSSSSRQKTPEKPEAASTSSAAPITTASFVPYSLQKKKEAEAKQKAGPAQTKPIAVAPAKRNDEDDEDETPATSSFFSFAGPVSAPSHDTSTKAVAYDQYGNLIDPLLSGPQLPPQPQMQQFPQLPDQYQYPQYPAYPGAGVESEEEDEGDDQDAAVVEDKQFQKILPKYGKEKGTAIHIKEVDPMNILKRKKGEHFDPTIADPFQSSFAAGAGKKRVGTTASRKHQITWLASKAVEMERELLEKAANGRMTKKQTQGKYGF